MAESVAPMVYQFKVTLKDSRPSIWRRIQVPQDFSFFDLHMAIQATMEWIDYHLHQFRVRNPRTGVREVISPRGRGDDDSDESDSDDFWGLLGVETKTLSEHACRIADYFPAPKSKGFYEYDMGDFWQHVVVLEKILPAEAGVQYPRCIAGKNAGPPEDCGGISGYEYLKEIIADPSHPEHKERLEWLEGVDWLGGDFNPAKFDPKAVKFWPF